MKNNTTPFALYNKVLRLGGGTALLFIALCLLFSCDSSTPGSDITPPLDPDMPEGNITIVSGDGLYAPTDTVQLSYEQQREVLWATDSSDLVAVDATGLVSVKQRTEAIEIQSVSIYAHSNGTVLGRQTLSIGDYSYDSDKKTYHIYTELGLNHWAESEDCLTANVVLERNIALTQVKDDKGSTWNGIGDTKNGYQAIFDGNDYTISGMKIKQTGGEQRFGFFRTIASNGTVKNLKLTDVNISTLGGYVGGIAGKSYGTITDCTVSGTLIETWRLYAGGIAGFVDEGSISGCVNYCKIYSATQSPTVGGIAGYAESCTISDCKNYAEVEAEGELNVRSGGIAGEIWFNAKIDNCYNKGNIVGHNVGDEQNDYLLNYLYVGGIVGSITDPSSTVTNCAIEDGITIYAYYYSTGIAEDPSVGSFVGKGTVGSGNTGDAEIKEIDLSPSTT